MREPQLTNESFYRMGYEDERQRVANVIINKILLCKREKANGYNTDVALSVLCDMVDKLHMQDLIDLNLLK